MHLLDDLGSLSEETRLQTLITSVLVILGLFNLVACMADQTKPIQVTHPAATAVAALPTPSHTVTPMAMVSNLPTSTPTPFATSTPTPLWPTVWPTATGDFYSTPFFVTEAPSYTPEPTPTDAIFPVMDTAVTYVIVENIFLEILRGPGFDYDTIDTIHWADIIQVTGQSEDGEWWRVLCPDNRVGSCWSYADYTIPVEAPTLEAMLPDPATLNSASKTIVPSPDGQWQATANESENTKIVDRFNLFYTTLTVTDGTTIWTPFAKWQHNSSVRGYPLRPRIVGWSSDGRYLYYTEEHGIDACFYFRNASNLIRLDVADGTLFEMLPENAIVNLSMSPDGKTLAYVTFDKSQLMLRNMESDNVERISLTRSESYAETGEIFWSADGKTAVFTLIHDWCSSDTTTHSSIMRIDADTLTVSPVIDNDTRLLRIQEWPDPTQNKVLVMDNEGIHWLLDIDSGELSAE